MSTFKFKYWSISPDVIPEPVAKLLLPMIKVHNDSLGTNNRHLSIFNQMKTQRGHYKGVCLGFGEAETLKIVKNLINTAREQAKHLKKDIKLVDCTV